MKYRRLLFGVKDPYSDSSDELFTKAVKENFSYCVSHCDDYRIICEISVYPLPRMRPDFP